YPLQEMLAFEFGMAQSTANAWIHLLSEVLQKVLDRGGYVPARDPKQLARVRESEAASTYGIDGTERPRQRPRDPEKQKHYYSGKKKPTRSSISCLAGSIRAKSIIGAKPMKANVMIKRLLRKKTPHTLQISVCIKIPAFKDMHLMV